MLKRGTELYLPVDHVVVEQVGGRFFKKQTVRIFVVPVTDLLPQMGKNTEFPFS